MAHELRNIIDNIKQVSMSDSSLSALLNFERVLDEMGLYAFQNWKLGELISGPDIGRYRVRCTFMWPHALMPDPAGAERLLNFGAKVKWGKDWLVYPVDIKTADDYRPGTKKPRMARKPVWTVEFDLPKHLVKDVNRSSQEILNNTLNLDDLDSAYEQDLDKQGVNAGQVTDQVNADMQNAAGAAPAAGGLV